jgi:hypothetical protein
MELDQDIINWHKLLEGLNTAKFGFTKPFYWIEMPDGKRKHFITRGKLWASLAVLRMNHPGIKLELVGKLSKPKEKK